MDILFDTNIFIHREDDDIVPEDLRALEKSLKEKDTGFSFTHIQSGRYETTTTNSVENKMNRGSRRIRHSNFRVIHQKTT